MHAGEGDCGAFIYLLDLGVAAPPCSPLAMPMPGEELGNEASQTEKLCVGKDI